MPVNKSVAYFSMEIALDPAMPTYSGGLGVLAGDTLRAAADRNLPMVAVTLLHRKGYFSQSLNENGWQTEAPCVWEISDRAEELPQRVSVAIEGRKVQLRAWRFDICGVSGGRVPVYLLDTDLPENSEWDRRLTDHLYGGDKWYRLCQEIVLGIGGVRMLRALGYNQLKRFHMNEGHAALLALELLDEQAQQAGRGEFNDEDLIAVHDLCVFTTHTPVPAGHDKFPMEYVSRALGRPDIVRHQGVFCCEGELNMTYLALNLSHYVNGVAKKHGEVSQHMFAQYKIDAITNGVHAATWTSEPFQALFDSRIPGWRDDSFMLRYALNFPQKEIWTAHQQAKAKLLERIQSETGAKMDPYILTLGFARRAATYKRADLIFRDLARLKSIAENTRKFQIVFAGKAHPQDQEGKKLIQRVWQASETLGVSVNVAYLSDYGWELGLLMTSGVDVWLNTPKPPMEASGTSGMKAALNGVPSLSILDGWWIEGCIEGTTGWAIDSIAPDAEDRTPHDAESLYDKLENVVIPLYYQDQDGWLDIMRHAIALNGSFFNTQRMLLQYVLKAYFV
ncbi:MAG: alpha-glucan family phosphorylase [Acidobacteria bacterium]|nr:alpha-glucan family phosphorylase [Acidobacteriota bacterium]